jgi:hypothetical protein
MPNSKPSPVPGEARRTLPNAASANVAAAPFGAEKRNAQNTTERRLRFDWPPPPPRPVVAGAPLRGEVLDFIEFISDPVCEDVCRILFGEETSAEQMLAEFRKATKSYLYGHRRSRSGRAVVNPGMLDRQKAASRKLLRQFVRRAYRGDPCRRGVQYWARVAALLWDTHHKLMALRKRAEKIKQREIVRIESLPAQRALRAEYMRRYRKRRGCANRSHNKASTKR